MAGRARNLAKKLPDTAGMLVAGFYALGWGFREASLAWRLRRRGLRAEGTVVENVRYVNPDSSSGPSWAPVIAFTDNAGNRVEFTWPLAGGSILVLRHRLGQTIPVVLGIFAGVPQRRR